MTLEELKEDLNNYMKEGTFTVKEVDDNRVHIIWNVNGNDYSAVIESRLLEMDLKNVHEELVRPIMLSFKQLKRRNEQEVK